MARVRARAAGALERERFHLAMVDAGQRVPSPFEREGYHLARMNSTCTGAGTLSVGQGARAGQARAGMLSAAGQRVLLTGNVIIWVGRTQ